MQHDQSVPLRAVPRHIHFVTGRLAEQSLREVLAELAPQAGFAYTVQVLPITVAALMTADWIAARLRIAPEAQQVMLPGYCRGDLSSVRQQAGGRTVELGPRDLRRLPEHFGMANRMQDYGRYDIEIIAEINQAPRLSMAHVLDEARRLAVDGADVIDVGCEPGEPWSGVREIVRALKDEGHRVSIDSHNVVEIEAAVRAGAELVLSVSAENREAAPDWGCEVVVVPEMHQPNSAARFDDTVAYLAEKQVPHRLDPVLSPLCQGFALSLGRYLDARSRHPNSEMMMGIGNVTELVDADSAAINVLLLGFCQEVGIRSVLTTEVIHWAQSSVRECDLARRLVHYAVQHGVLAKHLEPRLIPLRGVKPINQGSDALDRLAAEIKDPNYRIFAEEGLLHVISSNTHLFGKDPFLVFEELLAQRPKNLNASHAFYLGYEMAKALTAITLDKEYRQDESLDWGFLTQPETTHRLPRRMPRENADDAEDR